MLQSTMFWCGKLLRNRRAKSCCKIRTREACYIGWLNIARLSASRELCIIVASTEMVCGQYRARRVEGPQTGRERVRESAGAVAA